MSITMEDVERALYERHLIFKNEYPDEYDRCDAEGKAYCKGSVNEFMKIVRLIYGKQDHFITMDYGESVVNASKAIQNEQGETDYDRE